MKRLLMLALISTPAAHAAVFNVTRVDDPAPGACVPADCSLREAIAAAQAAMGADTVRLPAGNFTLGSALPSITAELTVEGQGVAATAIVDAGRVFTVAGASLTVRGVAMRGGSVGGVPAEGGAIAIRDGALLLDSCEIRGVGAVGLGFGGALYAARSSVELRNTMLRQNYASIGGGAISLLDSSLQLTQGTQVRDNEAAHGGAMWLQHSGSSPSVVTADPGVQISYNFASAFGGAMSGKGVELRVSGAGGLVLLEGNTAMQRGGAVQTSGRATLSGVHLMANTAEGEGEGIVSAAAVSIEDTWFDFNEAAKGAALVITGGAGKSFVDRSAFRGNRVTHAEASSAMLVRSDAVYVSNVDFYDNRGGANRLIDNAGNLYLLHASVHRREAPLGTLLHQRGGSATLANTLVGGGCSGTMANISSAGGNQPITLSHGVTPCPLGTLSDRPAVSASTLGVAHKQTAGHFPVTTIVTTTSPLLDRGLGSLCSPEDVYGRTRPALCDIGAFESGAH